jgi:rubrerythrin
MKVPATPSSIRNFLEVCISIERLSADVYHSYSRMYQNMRDVSLVWKKAAVEEEEHKRQFELALRLMNEAEFEVSMQSVDKAYSIQYKLLKLMNLIKFTKPELSVAFAKAVEMEEKLVDLHVHTALNFKDEKLQKLFNTMGEADREHVAALQLYQKTLECSTLL